MKKERILKLLPILVPFVFIFFSGILLTVLQSFGKLTPSPDHDSAFFAYSKVLSSRWFYRSFFYSLRVALLSASISVLFGTIFAYLVFKLPLKDQRFSIVYKIPLILPHISVAFIVFILWGKSGIFSSLSYKFGLTAGIENFPDLLYSGRGWGIVTAYIYKEIPFVMLMVLAVLRKFDTRQETVARELGAGRVRTFRKIVLPHLTPVMHTTFIILFLYSFGAFDIPFLIGESDPSMLSIQVFNLYFKRDLANRPYAMAILTLMLIFGSFFIYFYTRVANRFDGRLRKL
jgi:putative spermidine/putrescine transport system permease protein